MPLNNSSKKKAVTCCWFCMTRSLIFLLRKSLTCPPSEVSCCLCVIMRPNSFVCERDKRNFGCAMFLVLYDALSPVPGAQNCKARTFGSEAFILWFVCVCLCARARAGVRVFVFVSVFVFVFMCLFMCVCACVCSCACACVWRGMCVRACVPVHAHVTVRVHAQKEISKLIDFLVVDADQSSVAPEIIITSTYWNWGPMLLRFVDLMAEDKWPGDFIYWGMREVCNEDC